MKLNKKDIIILFFFFLFLLNLINKKENFSNKKFN